MGITDDIVDVIVVLACLDRSAERPPDRVLPLAEMVDHSVVDRSHCLFEAALVPLSRCPPGILRGMLLEGPGLISWGLSAVLDVSSSVATSLLVGGELCQYCALGFPARALAQCAPFSRVTVAACLPRHLIGTRPPVRDDYSLAQVLEGIVLVELALSVSLGAAWADLYCVAAWRRDLDVASVLALGSGSCRSYWIRSPLTRSLETNALVHSEPLCLPYLGLHRLHCVLRRPILVHRHELLRSDPVEEHSRLRRR